MAKVEEKIKQDVSVTEQPEVNNEIQETTGSEVEVYEDYDTTDLSDSAGKKKRFKIK